MTSKTSLDLPCFATWLRHSQCFSEDTRAQSKQTPAQLLVAETSAQTKRRNICVLLLSLFATLRGLLLHRCEKKCSNMKGCGRHQCRRRCCDGECPPCDLACGRRLRCGNHKCPAPCHSGPCLPCPLTSTVACACGGTRYSLPCGSEAKAVPPQCRHVCPVPVTCRHAETRPPHRSTMSAKLVFPSKWIHVWVFQHAHLLHSCLVPLCVELHDAGDSCILAAASKVQLY